MGKSIPVFNINSTKNGTGAAADIKGQSVQSISSQLKGRITEKGAGATVSGRLSKDRKFSETNACLYVRHGDRSLVQRFWEALTLKDVTQKKAASVAVEHLLQRFEEQPDAKPILADIRKEMRRSGGEIKAKALQDGLNALIEKFDANEGGRKQIDKLDDKAISRLANKSGISVENFQAMRGHVQHRHLLLLGKPAGTPPLPQKVAQFASQILHYASISPGALEPDLRALYFEAKAFASVYPELMNLRPGMLHTPTLIQDPSFVEAAKLLGGEKLDEGELDDAAQKLAGAVAGQLTTIGLIALFATQGAQYRLELSKALMDAVASQGKKGDSGLATLPIPFADLFQRLDTFSAAVFSHVQKAYEAHFDGDSLIEFSADGSSQTWTRDAERSAADGAAGISLYRNGKQTKLVKEIDVRPDSQLGAVPIDRQQASDEVVRHMEVNAGAPGLAPDVSCAPSTNGKVRLVMERPGYGNMGQFINSQLLDDDRRPEAARAMTRKIADALNELHQLNMSHGAFSPEDVVMAPGEDDDVVVKLTNFGAAHKGAFMYAREDKVASPQLKSPERLAPVDTPQDPREPSFSPQKDDVWAFGLMVCKLIYGASAFAEDEAGFEIDLQVYRKKYVQRPVDRAPRQNDTFLEQAREFIMWVLNPDPANRPTMAEILRDPFLQKAPGEDAINLIHETGQLQDFLDWGPAHIREFSAETGIGEVQIRAMIQYLKEGRDKGDAAVLPDNGLLVGFITGFKTYFKQRGQGNNDDLLFALNNRVEALAKAHPDLVANQPATGVQPGSPAIVPTPDSVKGVLGKLQNLNPVAGAEASGVLASEMVNGQKGPHFGVRVRNGDRNILQRITDRLTGAHIARRKAAQQAVEHLIKRFKDQPGATQILENLRSTIRNPGKTLLAQQLAGSLNKLVEAFDLGFPSNAALKEFVGRTGAEVIAFSQLTGIPEELVTAMQAYLRHRSGLLDGSASGEPPSLELVAAFASKFDQYMREAPTVLADTALLALEAEVRAFSISRPDLMGLRPGMVHTPGLTEKISFGKAAKLLAQPGEIDERLAVDAAKQLARLIVRSLQDPKNPGRDLTLLFASSLGVAYCTELSNALHSAIVAQGPARRSESAQPPLDPGEIARRLTKFSQLVYAEVLQNMPNHCEGEDIVEGDLATKWTKRAVLSSDGASAEVFVYENGDDTVVVKEMKSYEARYGKHDPADDFKEARLHQHINAAAPAAAAQLNAVVQAGEGKVRFVMEHAVHGDLAGFMKKVSSKPDHARNEVRFSLCKQVAEILYELHTLANVGHIDFKPANVLLTRGAGGAVLAQLTDFGASREGNTMFVRDDPVDSPHWKSPERLVARNGTDAPRFSTHAADVWAFGVTMYQMYAKDGSNPFDRTDFNSDIGPAILDYATNYRATAIAGGNLDFDADEIPEYVRPFIRWILNPDPAARPTMAEILQHRLMTSTRPLSAPARTFIQTSVGADPEGDAGVMGATGARTRPATPPDGVESDEVISSSDAPPPRRASAAVIGDEESFSIDESVESAPDSQSGGDASGSTSDSSAEESTESEVESGPSGTFRANVVPDRPDTDNEKAMKKSAETGQANVGMNTMLNPHQKVKRQRKGVTPGTFVKPSESEESS
jgi:serine/threonine protein kinase